MTYYEHVIRNFEKYSGKSNYVLEGNLLKFLKDPTKGDTMQKVELETFFLIPCLISTNVSALGKNIH
jgi:hypothetical protein